MRLEISEVCPLGLEFDAPKASPCGLWNGLANSGIKMGTYLLLKYFPAGSNSELFAPNMGRLGLRSELAKSEELGRSFNTDRIVVVEISIGTCFLLKCGSDASPLPTWEGVKLLGQLGCLNERAELD